MIFVALAFCLSLMALAAAGALASVACRPLFRRAATAGLRPGTLLALRYAPTLAALLFTGLVFLPAFLHLEPRASGERIGPLMIVLAAASCLALAAGPLRGLRSALATGRLARRWRLEAEAIALPGSPAPAFAIDTEFPLVAVVGILRPRLYVARRVLRGCTDFEMAAIVAHESAHHRRRDNLKQMLFRACPDVLAHSRAALAMERAWVASCDRAADDEAARRGSRVELASALVKVARALDTPAPAGGIMAAFCRGDDVVARARRLLQPGPASAAARRADRALPAVLIGATLAAALVGQGPAVRLAVHGAAETIVRWLQ